MPRTEDQIGRYTLISKIGRGQFGEVWLAENRAAITTRFALKFPVGDDVDLDAIKREAHLWAQATGHPNVLSIIEGIIVNNQLVIVSEYVEDGSLAQWLRRYGGAAPSLEAAFNIVDGILAGLHHLHARHIIHRDLKPANILLQGGIPRIADFGISRFINNTTQTNTRAGSFAYMAPEAFYGTRSEQTDIWSVGVILYQLVAGRLPFPQLDEPSLMKAILIDDPVPLSLPSQQNLKEIISHALDKNVAQRYITALEMRKALREVIRKTYEDSELARTVINDFEQRSQITQDASNTLPTRPLNLRKTGVNQQWKPFMQWRLDGQSHPIAFWLDGKTIASLNHRQVGKGPSTEIGIVTVLDVTTGKSVGSYTLDTVSGGAFSPNGQLLAVVDRSDVITLRYVQTGRIQQTLRKSFSNRKEMTFSPDGRTLATGGFNFLVELINIQNDFPVKEFKFQNHRVHPFGFSPDGKLLGIMSTGKNDTIELWDIQKEGLHKTECRLKLTGDNFWWDGAISFSPDGRLLASKTGESVSIWNVINGYLQREMKIDTRSLAFLPDSDILICGGTHLSQIDLQTGRVIQETNEDVINYLKRGDSWAHTSVVRRLAFSPDGRTLASWRIGNGGEIGLLTLWNSQ